MDPTDRLGEKGSYREDVHLRERERETVATVELFTRTNGGRFVPALSLADQKPHKQGDKFVKGWWLFFGMLPSGSGGTVNAKNSN